MALVNASEPSVIQSERKRIHAEEKEEKIIREKIQTKLCWMAVACCLMMLMVIPIQGDSVSSSITYNEVLLNGEVIGAVADPEVVNQAFLNARARIARETEGLVLGNVECSFQKVPRLFGTTLEQSELENVIYDLLKEQVKAAKQKYYLVKVNEFTVYLYGIDEVKALLEAALKPYDPDGLFEVNVISDTSRELNVFTVEVTPKEELAEGECLKALNFSEKVEISEAYVDADRGIEDFRGHRSGDQGNGEKPDL